MALATSGGCVSHRLIIDSKPVGAEVRLNGKMVGATPVVVPFRHYGIYRVVVRHEGFTTRVVDEEVLAPWYSRFPVCLFSELLIPWRITDDRYVCYELDRPAPGAKSLLLEKANREAD